MAVDWELFYSRVAQWVLAGTGLPESKILWSQNKAPRPAADGIVMRVMHVDFAGDGWVDYEDNPLVFADKAMTSVDAATNTATLVGHGLSTGAGPVRVSTTGTLPGGLAVDTDYWLIAPTANTLKFAATFIDTGGADIANAPSGNPITPIDLSSAGTGTLTISCTDDTVAAGAELAYVASGQMEVVVTIECHTVDSIGSDTAVAVLHRLAARANLPSMIAILDEAGAGVLDLEPVKAIRGKMDALAFEPRAVLDVMFSIVADEREVNGTIIQTADLTPTVNEAVGATERVRVGPRP